MAGVLASLGAAIIVMALWEPLAASQAANPPVGPSSSQIEPAAVFVAELSKSIDAKKTRPNDPVAARLTMDVLAHGHIVIPRGTKILGHVTAATARSRDLAGSRVEIAFDRIVLKNGLELPLQASLRAIGAPLRVALPQTRVSSDVDLPSPASTLPSPGPNEMRETYSHAPPGSRRPANAGGPSEGLGIPGGPVGPSLGPASEGVVGMKGIELTSTAQASAITSTRENVHLSGGTQLVLRISDPRLLLDSLQKNREQTGLQPRK